MRDTADISMGYNSITGLAEEVSSIQADFETMCAEMDKLIKSLDDKWDGAAHKEFLTSYRKVKTKLSTVSATLKQYTSSIGKVLSYELETEKQTSLTF